MCRDLLLHADHGTHERSRREHALRCGGRGYAEPFAAVLGELSYGSCCLGRISARQTSRGDLFAVQLKRPFHLNSMNDLQLSFLKRATDEAVRANHPFAAMAAAEAALESSWEIPDSP